MEEIRIKIKAGEVVFKRPTAGVRNEAMVKSVEKGDLNPIKMMVELLPKCIKSHPWGNRPINQCINSLDFAEYDLLIDGLKKIIKPEEKGEEIKKSETSLEAEKVN